MITLSTITISSENGERVIYITPVKLDPKELVNLKPGRIKKLHLYDDLRDERYRADSQSQYQLSIPYVGNFVINYGQIFEDYYLGEVEVDFDQKSYSTWKGASDRFSAADLKAFIETLFNKEDEHDRVTIFTPTKPSDINISLRNE